MDATPPPGREPLDLNSAVRNAVSASFGDVVVGLALVLLFSFSFVGAWFQTELFCPEPVVPGPIYAGGTGICAEWVPGGTLWSGFGLLPALLLVGAMLFFVVRRLSRVRLTLPIPEGVVWMVFGVVETGLLFLYWVIPSPAGVSPYLSSTMATPGWAFWVAVGLGGLLVAGGALELIQGDSGRQPAVPGAPAEHLGAGVALRPVPAGPRAGAVIAGVALVALFAFSFVGTWFQASVGCVVSPPIIRGGLLPYIPSCPASTYFFGSLWSGLGLLPALLLVGGLLFFVIRRLPQVRLRLPVPEALIWVLFAAVEVGLFVLNWVTSNGGVLGTSPGWGFWVGVGLAGLLGVGGCVMFFEGEGAGLPRATPGLPVSTLPVGTLSPDGKRWFDGSGWRDAAGEVPPGAPRSEDGGHWWDGAGWRPVPAAPSRGAGRGRGAGARGAPEPPPE
ncbi:MAG: hypothetical protein ABSA40_05490 [Candidatus Dormibacteria bacterium]